MPWDHRPAREDSPALLAWRTLLGVDTGLPLTCHRGLLPAPPPCRCLVLSWCWSSEKSPWCPGTSPRRGPRGSAAGCQPAGVSPSLALPGQGVPVWEVRVWQGQPGPAGSIGAGAAACPLGVLATFCAGWVFAVACPVGVPAALVWLGAPSSAAVSDLIVHRSASGERPRCRADQQAGEKPAPEPARERRERMLSEARKLLGGKSSCRRPADEQGHPVQLGAAIPSSAGELSPLSQETRERGLSIRRKSFGGGKLGHGIR